MGEKAFESRAEGNPELGEFLQSSDSRVLRDIFERAAKDAGHAHAADLPGADRIDESTGFYGEYHPDGKRVSLNILRIKGAAEALGVDWQPLAQKIFIHENVHAFTDRGTQKGRMADHNSLGYQETDRIKFTPLGMAFYQLWNEGCTELWARRLFREYQAESRGMSDADVDSFFEKIAGKKGTGAQDPYEDEVELVKTFSEYLAKEHHLNAAVMEQSVIEGMITGEMLQEPDSLKILEKILPPHFLEDLKNTDYHATARRLTKELKARMEKPQSARVPTNSFTRRLLRIAESIMESQSHLHGS